MNYLVGRGQQRYDSNFGNAVLAPKRLQLLRELVPKAVRFGVLADPTYPPTPSTIADLQAAARTLGLQLTVENARNDSDLESAFATFSQQHVGAVLVSNSTLYNRHTEDLAALAARHALPAIFPKYALAGGVMSYGSSLGMRTEVAPLSWTPHCLGFWSPQWQRSTRAGIPPADD